VKRAACRPFCVPALPRDQQPEPTILLGKQLAKEDEVDETSNSRNEGEGNRTAARAYNEAQHRFVESGKVEQKAREAATAMNSPERAELERAEAVGREHAADGEAGTAQVLAQRARQQATNVGEYLSRNVNEYPLEALLVAGLIGYGLGFLIHLSGEAGSKNARRRGTDKRPP